VNIRLTSAIIIATNLLVHGPAAQNLYTNLE